VYGFSNTFSQGEVVFFGLLTVLGSSPKEKSATPVGDNGETDTFSFFVMSSLSLFIVLVDNISTASHNRAVINLSSFTSFVHCGREREFFGAFDSSGLSQQSVSYPLSIKMVEVSSSIW